MALFKALVWALIFLTKLRFPPGVSIAIAKFISNSEVCLNRKDVGLFNDVLHKYYGLHNGTHRIHENYASI